MAWISVISENVSIHEKTMSHSSEGKGENLSTESAQGTEMNVQYSITLVKFQYWPAVLTFPLPFPLWYQLSFLASEERALPPGLQG